MKSITPKEISSELKEQLTAPTKSFKKHVFFAVLGLFSFIAIYLTLMIWFGYLAYDLFLALASGSGNVILTLITSVCLAFLSLFMFKSLFIFNKNKNDIKGEITASDEPELFKYIYDIADEAGAPRPYKVFLSARVNACVFYDLSILNLIFPSKKNLEIGLGLINVLNVGELKAVLAHEFGHFAQKSMLLGRYVYTAQQIAVRVVNKRDILDSFLAGLSNVDIRIAWIGWLLSIMVWAVRALIQTLFSVVVIAERALSREMEFQADLVAVSLTGSDALIHGLHKLKAADEGYHVALDIVNKQLDNKKAVEDLFSLQTNYIEKMKWILNNPSYGMSPLRRSKDGKERIFSNRSIAPPEMWATHPADNEREENAKRIYVYSEIDTRSSWNLFKDAKTTRKNETANLIETAKVETSLISEQDSIKLMNELNYNWSFLDPKYRGNYLARYTFLNLENIDEFYDQEIGANIDEDYLSLYPDSLDDSLEKHKELEGEIVALKDLLNESLTAEKRKRMYRGKEIKKKEIPTILKQLEKEELELRQELTRHDIKCRSLNYIAGKILQSSIGDYVKELGTLIHYAEHTISDLNDIAGKFHNTLHVVLADGRVTSSEMNKLIQVANELYKVIKPVFDESQQVKLTTDLNEKLGGSYAQLFEEFKLGRPDNNNIQDWVNVVDQWIFVAQKGLIKLRNIALEELLKKEDEIQNTYLKKGELTVITSSMVMPKNYNKLTPGKERRIEQKLSFWNRFHLGDGIIPSIAKFSVSAAMIGGALYVGNISQELTLHMYNGLSIPVNVELNGTLHRVPSNYNYEVAVNYKDKISVLAKTLEGDTIEYFNESIDEHSNHYIYNVANSSYFLEYIVSYGYDVDLPDEPIGVGRWFANSSDYILEEPPGSISGSSSSNGATRHVLTTYGATNPYYLLDVDKDISINKMVLSHIKWDSDSSANILYWGSIAASIDSTLSFLDYRLKQNPTEVISYRLKQDYSSKLKRVEICNVCNEQSKLNPENPDLYYLAARCIEDEIEKDQVFLSGYEKWSDHKWLTYAAAYVYAGREDWTKSYNCFQNTLTHLPQLNSSIIPNFVRIARLLDKDIEENKIIKDNEWFYYYNQIENGDEDFLKNNPSKIHYLLSKNKIKEAISHSKIIDVIEANYYSWYIAASVNCPSDVLRSTINKGPEESMNTSNMWVSLALLARENKDYSKFIKYASDNFNLTTINYTNVTDFIKAVKAKKINRAKEILNKEHAFNTKLSYKLMAVIILNKRAPKQWIKDVNKLVFITEKPFLGK